MSAPEQGHVGVERLEVGIPGFDLIALGGIPRDRTTLLVGSAGSGKTVFAVQYLVAGIERYDERGVLVTLVETPADLARNVRSFGWDLERMAADGHLAFVDASPVRTDEESVETGEFDFLALLARIEHAVRSVGARRVAIDSIDAVLLQFADQSAVRRELGRLIATLGTLGVTSVLTGERPDEHAGPLARHPTEEYVADNVVVLRNTLVAERRRRTIEILKVRGATHQKGSYPFAIDPTRGITVLPLSAYALQTPASTERVSLGNEELDAMLGGGSFRDSLILVSGATGSGKTLVAATFAHAAAAAGERALLFSFEETAERLVRNASSWGMDLAAAERSGNLMIVSRFPERMSTEDLLVTMISEIEAFGPTRVAIDNLSALGNIAPPRAFREFLVGLANELRRHAMAVLVTNTTATLLGGESITQAQFSTMTDAIMLLRYVEVGGQVRRCVVILKMRGSRHDHSIREYTIGDDGMRVIGAIEGLTGVLAGEPTVLDAP
ncbi:MAG: circadian clock protein KaiC [Solirubrobacteraceae bacterium]|nr:circadian clock protein KaiC [Solirubrobacteraceae bacterium]